mmetsp:Transcript_51082/g.111073  ORF Transcript_51082/g.111073 Transcript_51082/m.111073 type:complete len:267 (-) Transcript_51082:7-807(-)
MRSGPRGANQTTLPRHRSLSSTPPLSPNRLSWRLRTAKLASRWSAHPSHRYPTPDPIDENSVLSIAFDLLANPLQVLHDRVLSSIHRLPTLSLWWKFTTDSELSINTTLSSHVSCAAMPRLKIPRETAHPSMHVLSSPNHCTGIRDRVLREAAQTKQCSVTLWRSESTLRQRSCLHTAQIVGSIVANCEDSAKSGCRSVTAPLSVRMLPLCQCCCLQDSSESTRRSVAVPCSMHMLLLRQMSISDHELGACATQQHVSSGWSTCWH